MHTRTCVHIRRHAHADVNAHMDNRHVYKLHSICKYFFIHWNTYMHTQDYKQIDKDIQRQRHSLTRAAGTNTQKHKHTHQLPSYFPEMLWKGTRNIPWKLSLIFVVLLLSTFLVVMIKQLLSVCLNSTSLVDVLLLPCAFYGLEFS